MIRVGTNYFANRLAAIAHYGNRTDQAISEGLIVIGEPEIDRAAGQRLFLDKSRRYYIGYPEAHDVRG